VYTQYATLFKKGFIIIRGIYSNLVKITTYFIVNMYFNIYCFLYNLLVLKMTVKHWNLITLY